MFRFIFICSLLLVSCSKKLSPAIDNLGNSVPRITWNKQTQDIGKVKKGETRDLVYTFTNSGAKPLIIDIVTTCRCTSIEWPKNPIPPGEKGVITATYDSSTQKIGKLRKTIDVIANTYPIVVEAFIIGEVIPWFIDQRDFMSNDRSQGWDGRFNGQLVEQGVYVYTVEYLNRSGDL